MSSATSADAVFMERALELARRGIGRVEPNPAVGAVVVDDRGQIIAEGWHEYFGGLHAEANALRAAGESARGATLFVTLEPCCHFGKTPPCSRAVIAAGIRRVVVGAIDPADHVAGKGIEELRNAGIEVDIGVMDKESRQLIAPFVKLMTRGLPWFHAKWAMTLDGKIATRTGSSQWISGEQSRGIVHELRGRMDAIMTGIGTVLHDDPLLTARPAGMRTATRIVLDSTCRTPANSQLLRTLDVAPVLIVTTSSAPPAQCESLQKAGAEVVQIPSRDDGRPDLRTLAKELGRRRMTNVLIESGGQLLGSCFDDGIIDEAHVFVAPKLVGGRDASTPVAGRGLDLMSNASQLDAVTIRNIGDDVYIQGRLRRVD